MAGDVHTCAVQAEAAVEQLATELAQAGADGHTVKGVSQMAEVLRSIVSALGKGQAYTADNAPPDEPEPQQHTMDSATAALHQAAMAAHRP